MAYTQFTDPSPVLARLSASLQGGQAGGSYSPFGQGGGGQSLQQLLGANSSGASAPVAQPWAPPPAPTVAAPTPPPEVDWGSIIKTITTPPTSPGTPPVSGPPQPTGGGGGPTYQRPNGAPIYPGGPGWEPWMGNNGTGTGGWGGFSGTRVGF